MLGSLTHVRLLVDEYERCFRFYAETLGGDPTFGEADFDTGAVTLALHDAAEVTDLIGEGARERDGIAVVLRVGSVEQADATLADTDCERVNLPEDRPERGIRVAHVREPDGTLVELNEPLES